MQPSAAAPAAPSSAPLIAASSAPGSFAGLLASFALPAKKPPASTWSDDGLADDVATLSYEQALRTHARYRREEAPAAPLPELPPASERLTIHEVFPNGARAAVQAADAPRAAPGVAARDAASPRQAATAAPAEQAVTRGRVLKNATVTIRMSESEWNQLRARAGESGLTVSAYLRSCTFEAERLRAQVKEALGELRALAQKNKEAAGGRPSLLRRFWRFWPAAMPAAH